MSITARIWNSTLTRKTPLRSKPPKLKQYKPEEKPKPRARLGRGKKMKAWDADRAKLKARFKDAGITICELRTDACTCDNYLGFAHSKKRRNVVTDQDREEVILVCNNCHDCIEALGETRMRARVLATIDARQRPVRSIFD